MLAVGGADFDAKQRHRASELRDQLFAVRFQHLRGGVSTVVEECAACVTVFLACRVLNTVAGFDNATTYVPLGQNNRLLIRYDEQNPDSDLSTNQLSIDDLVKPRVRIALPAGRIQLTALPSYSSIPAQGPFQCRLL